MSQNARLEEAILEPRIIDRGRGPEIEGTRITVYDVMVLPTGFTPRESLKDCSAICSTSTIIEERVACTCRSFLLQFEFRSMQQRRLNEHG